MRRLANDRPTSNPDSNSLARPPRPPAAVRPRRPAPSSATESLRIHRMRPTEVAEHFLHLLPGLCRYLEGHHGYLQSVVRPPNGKGREN